MERRLIPSCTKGYERDEANSLYGLDRLLPLSYKNAEKLLDLLTALLYNRRATN